MLPKPKKSLGQNFLIDQNIRRKIISACMFSGSDSVLEIGGGTGAMTGLIAERVARLICVEIDSALAEELQTQYAGRTNVTVLHADILSLDIEKLFPDAGKIKVFGNIPYYITSPIIERLVDSRGRISEAFLTVQKEFGQRMVAGPGTKTYGSFSCFVNYYTEPELLFLIKKNSFRPAPSVDSCFLRLRFRAEPAFPVRDEHVLFKLIRSAFQQRRKMITKSLRQLVPEQDFENFFSYFGIDRKIRPEQLSLEHFAYLANSA